MLIHNWVACLCLCLVTTDVIFQVNGQRNKNARKKKTFPKKTVGGRWIPLKQRLAAKKRQSAAKKNNKPRKGSLPSRGGSVNFDNLIQPPLSRSPNEVKLQDPSWTHCIHKADIDSSWSRITSPNYPQPIKGQLQCTWIFEGSPGKKLQVSFADLDLLQGKGNRCGNQFIDIIDLELQKSQGRFCGDKVPGDYVTVGRRLRLDIQADTTLTPHKGFQAAVRSVPYIVQPGLRQRSTLLHGPPTLPPTTTKKLVARRPGVGKRQKVVTTTLPTTTTSTRLLFGRNPYGFGANRQPPRAEVLTFANRDGVDTTIILYALIGLFCLILVATGIAFIFRKQLYAKYKAYKRKKKEKREEKKKKKEKSKLKKEKEDDDNDDKNKAKSFENETISKSRFELPISKPTTPSLDGRRRKSVVFEDEVEKDFEKDVQHETGSLDRSSTDDAASQNNRGKSFNNAGERFQGWNYPHGEPIYEDDALSVCSYSSDRSLSRNQGHLTPRQQKIIEKNRELMESDPIYAPCSEPIYHIGAPYGRPVPHNLPPPFYPGYGPSFQDPRALNPVYPHMITPPDSYSRGRPMPPFSGARRHETSSASPPPIYDDYHQGKFITPTKNQEDTSNHEPKKQMETNENNLTASRSTGNFSMAESENESGLYSTQSMSTLPLTSDNFSGRKLERSYSFSG